MVPTVCTAGLTAVVLVVVVVVLTLLNWVGVLHDHPTHREVLVTVVVNGGGASAGGGGGGGAGQAGRSRWKYHSWATARDGGDGKAYAISGSSGYYARWWWCW